MLSTLRFSGCWVTRLSLVLSIDRLGGSSIHLNIHVGLRLAGQDDALASLFRVQGVLAAHGDAARKQLHLATSIEASLLEYVFLEFASAVQDLGWAVRQRSG